MMTKPVEVSNRISKSTHKKEKGRSDKTMWGILLLGERPFWKTRSRGKGKKEGKSKNTLTRNGN